MTLLPHRVRLALHKPDFTLDVDLTLPPRGITVLYGPSGSGKTSILRGMAGLEGEAKGYVCIGGQVWQDDANGVLLPTHRRPLGYVFQEASLFAHLDVAGNLAFARKRASVRAGGSELLTTDYVIRTLGLSHLLHRRTAQLSGGERQRVAIARALATNPEILLLDEPLASLDEARRNEVLPWLERLAAELHIPMVYVTHASEEVIRLADHLVILEQGRARAAGPLEQVLAQTDPVVHVGGDISSVVQGCVAGLDSAWHLAEVAFAGGVLWIPDTGLQPGQEVRLRVLARDVSVSTRMPAGSSIQNAVACSVSRLIPDHHPAQALVQLDASGTMLWARLTRRAVEQLGLREGMPVWAQVKAMALLR
jgi:molybdate transport system ATP-binding protein